MAKKSPKASLSDMPPLRPEYVEQVLGVARPSARRTGKRASASETEQVLAVVGTAYDASLDPALWPKALEQACKLLDCFQGALGAVDLLQRSANLLIPWGYEPHYWQRYLDQYHQHNPLAAPSLRLAPGEIFSISRYRGDFDYASYFNSEPYREWVEPQGQVDGIQVTLERTGSGVAVLAGGRHRDVGYAGPTEFRRMRLIAPHFRRAFLIGKAIDLHKVEAAAFAETISGLATAVFLLNAGGGLVHANRSAEAMLHAEDPVRVSRGLLLAFDERAHKALAKAFAAAGTGDTAGGAGGSAVPLVGKDGRHFVAHVLPLTAGARREAEASLSAVAALFVREATVDLGAAIAAATQLYGFTPTEERVLRGVIELGGLAAVASMLGIARRTAQTHLERLFAKTGTHRQADLARLIAGYDSPARRAGKA